MELEYLCPEINHPNGCKDASPKQVVWDGTDFQHIPQTNQPQLIGREVGLNIQEHPSGAAVSISVSFFWCVLEHAYIPYLSHYLLHVEDQCVSKACMYLAEFLREQSLLACALQVFFSLVRWSRKIQGEDLRLGYEHQVLDASAMCSSPRSSPTSATVWRGEWTKWSRNLRIRARTNHV